MSPLKKVITIGEILVEIMAVEPGNGFLEPMALVGPFPSGAPAIFIDQVGKLGQPAGLISAVGKDDFGRINLDRLRADGVDVSAVQVDPDRVTGSAFVRYRPDGNRDFVFNMKHSANGAIRSTEAVDALMASADHLHVMGTALFSEAMIDLILVAMDRIKAAGGTISFDPNIRKEMLELPGYRAALERIFSGADLFMPSGEELFFFGSPKDETAAIADILARGIKAIVVKRGAAGSSYFDTATSLHIPAFKVEEIDPTGAGDSFGATFVTCWLRGMEPATALRHANAAGALAVGVTGPMEGNAGFEAISRFIAAHQG